MKERTAAILNKIIISELPVSVERLSEEYDVSFRTIRNDIGEINEYLQEHQLPFVQQKRSQGYFIELTEEEIYTIKQLAFEVSLDEYLTREERILDIILDIGLGNQPVFLTQKERKYHVSKSSIDEDMRQIRQKL
ncbi:HTH domain-containing protein, partial [Sphingomonas sp. NCPPB 2930]